MPNTLNKDNDELIGSQLISRELSGNFTDDVLVKVGNGAFYNCVGLTSIDLPNVTTLDNNAFNGCTGLTSANLPKLTDIGAAAFYNCSNLSTIYMPLVSNLSTQAFYGCSGITTLDFPNLSSPTGASGFSRCSALEYIDLHQCYAISANTFQNCSALTTVILRITESRCSLVNVNAFSTAPNAIIYVPDDMVDGYKTATNWSTYASRIKGLSELPAA